MILPSDSAYQETKAILLGHQTIHPDFVPIANFIDRQFGVKPINIIYNNRDEKERPSLIVCVEYPEQAVIFNDPLNTWLLEKAKEKLIMDYLKELWGSSMRSIVKAIWSGSRTHRYTAKDMIVFFRAFEPVAKMEANQRIPNEDITQLKETLHHPDLWEIARISSYVTFFLYTAQQVREFENSKERKYWADRYFDLLIPYNEFGYFKREDFDIFLDSKENFDQNYESNWYYYYK